MFRPGTDEDNVQMSDVLCDFCARAWTEDVPFIEGHRGRVICGRCLAVAYTDLVIGKAACTDATYACVLCRESAEDRAALERADEPGWASPIQEDATVCRRCVKRAAGVLHKDPDFDWTKPAAN